MEREEWERDGEPFVKWLFADNLHPLLPAYLPFFVSAAALSARWVAETGKRLVDGRLLALHRIFGY